MTGLPLRRRLRQRRSDAVRSILLERSLGALLLMVPVALATAPDVGATPQAPVGEVVRATQNAVVRVSVRFDRPAGQVAPPGSPLWLNVVRPSSGVFVSSSGLVLTNAHLVAEVPDGPRADDAEYWVVVTRPNGVSYDATVLARDERTDLALLQVDVPTGRRMPALPLGTLEGREAGERVLALGQAERIQTHVFAGTLGFSAGPVQLNDAVLEPGETVKTDSHFHVMLDGAPLIDTRGRILGLHNASHLGGLDPAFHHDPDSGEPPPASTDYQVIVSADAIRASFGDRIEAAGQVDVPLDDSIRVDAPAALATIAPSVVSVWTADEGGAPAQPDVADPHGQRVPETLGSGVVVGAGGLVLTSSDLFQGDDRTATIRLADGTTYSAEAVALKRSRNAALLQVDLPEGTTLPAATIADSLVAGEAILVASRPHRELCISGGVLSALERQGRVQLATWVHAGHWGGALVDRHGHLLGIAVDQPTVAERAASESYLGFAAPVEPLREVFEEHWPADEVAGAEGGLDGEATPVTPTDTGSRRNDVADVVESTRSSLVNVIVSQAIPKASSGFDPFAEDEADEFRMLGQGSGVIIHESGLTISNWHVVDAAMRKNGAQSDDHQVKVTLPDGREFEVRVLSTSRDDDLALLKILLPPGEEVVPVEMGDSDRLEEGDVVIAIGNPLGLANSASAGIVSALDLDVQIQGRLHPYDGMLMTDAAINPGNSGGALLDAKGRLVGINSAGSTGHGMAIPVNKAKRVFSGKLLSAEKLRSTYLGIDVEELGDELRIDAVDPLGPGAAAGLERNDLVRTMNGTPIRSQVDFAQIQLAARAGTPIRIEVQRGQETVAVDLDPLDFLAWTAARRTGVLVREVDFATEAEAVRAASLALHQAYTGNPRSRPATLMAGALRITQVTELFEDRPLELQPGDWLLGVSEVERGLDTDRVRLRRFESYAELDAVLAPLATRRGNARTFWFLRGGEIFQHELFVQRP